MLKSFSIITAFVIIIFLSCTSCATQETTADAAATSQIDTIAAAPVKPGPLSSIMDAYYKVKDAFVKTDGAAADMEAMQFRLSIDSLDAKKLKLDTSYTTAITGYKKTMLSSIDSLIKQRDMQEKRRQFETISDALYSLAKATPYQGETIYQIHCPMAFNKKGANWLNNQSVVNNPYFGNKMLDCGEVTDSLVGK